MSIKEWIRSAAHRNREAVLEIHSKVWEYAEKGMQENRSAAAYVKLLRELGFQVDEGVSGIPSAFVAQWGSGKPVIGFLAEYDALPTLSQEAGCPVKKPVVEGGWGHGCGHNALGAGAMGAALIYRDWLQENGLPGTVRFYGCPGEEMGSGKVFMARDGLYDDLDACLTWHPANFNLVDGGSSLANYSIFYDFTGVSSHAAAAPYLGRSALDACELMSVGCNYLREHIIPEARLHYAYVDAGGTAPNVVQNHARVHYFIRAPKVKQMMEILERVNEVARGASIMTGTTLKVIHHEALSDYVPNHTLGALAQEAFEELGAPDFDENDYALAARFRDTFTANDLEQPFQNLKDRGIRPDVMDKGEILCDTVLPYSPVDKAIGGSTDVGDASYCAPTMQLRVATCAMGTPGHSWQLTAQSGSVLSEKGTMTAAMVMAYTAMKAHQRPDVLVKAREELNAVTGGKYICPLPDDIKPILDL